MARLLAGDRTEIVHYPGSLHFIDSANMYVSIPAHTSYQQDIIGSFTMLAKVYLFNRTDPANPSLSIFNNNLGSNFNNQQLFVTNATKKLNAMISTGSSNQLYTSTASLKRGWNTVGMSYSAGGNLSAIINQTIESTPATITAVASAITSYIGTSSNINLRLNGFMTHFMMLSGVIGQAELDDFVLGNAMPSLSQALMYTMDTGSATTVFDRSGNSNNGTLAGGVSWSTVVPTIERTDAETRTTATNRTNV